MPLSTTIKSEINSSITPGCGVFLKWKNNALYKIHRHWLHLDVEDGLLVLIGPCSWSDLKSVPNLRASNRTPGSMIAYVPNKLK